MTQSTLLNETEVLLSLAEGTKANSFHVCFVCTGNTCRSPMAAAVLNHLGRPYNITAESAGVSPYVGEPIAKNAIDALNDAGIEPSPDNRYDLHTARLIDGETIERCDRVIAMTEGHLYALMNAFPQYLSKFSMLEGGVSDPYGGDLDRYKSCLKEISDKINETFHLDN